MPQFLDALNAEIEGLERQLMANPSYAKLRELLRVQQLYETPHESDRLRESPDSGQTRARVVSSGGRVSRNQATIDTVAQHLSHHPGKKVRTSDILADLLRKDIQVRGVDPRNALSAMMSHSGRFQSHGREGWTLKGAAQNAEAADAISGETGTPAASNELRSTTEGTQAVVAAQDSNHVNPWSGGGT